MTLHDDARFELATAADDDSASVIQIAMSANLRSLASAKSNVDWQKRSEDARQKSVANKSKRKSACAARRKRDVPPSARLAQPLTDGFRLRRRTTTLAVPAWTSRVLLN
jgi:hypothetical protein